MAISAKLLNDGERVVISTRTHVEEHFGPLVVLVVLLAAGVAVQVWLDERVVTMVVWALVALAIAETQRLNELLHGHHTASSRDEGA